VRRGWCRAGGGPGSLKERHEAMTRQIVGHSWGTRAGESLPGVVERNREVQTLDEKGVDEKNDAKGKSGDAVAGIS